MKHTFCSLVLLSFVLAGCADQQAALETTEKIIETGDAIEENRASRDSLEFHSEKYSDESSEGPMPADKYSLNKTGKFIYLAAYRDGHEKTWLLLKAKSADDVRAKYPEFEVYENRPDWMSEEQKQKIVSNCLKKDLAWDLGAEPTGWLKDFEKKNK